MVLLYCFGVFLKNGFFKTPPPPSENLDLRTQLQYIDLLQAYHLSRTFVSQQNIHIPTTGQLCVFLLLMVQVLSIFNLRFHSRVAPLTVRTVVTRSTKRAKHGGNTTPGATRLALGSMSSDGFSTQSCEGRSTHRLLVHTGCMLLA